MFIDIPHKKMKKVNGFGLVAECDCSHKHRFKSSEIDLENSNSSTTLFKNIYTCPKCRITYNGIFETISDRNSWYRNLSPIGVLISILLVFGLSYGGLKVYNVIFNSPQTNTDINKATNRELNEFFEWDHKQQQQKRENQPAFNNGN